MCILPEIHRFTHTHTFIQLHAHIFIKKKYKKKKILNLLYDEKK